ncbi:MAG TPA: aminotransferase class III-fold pyridoxal phosphate-dependent enzyme [Thermotogota bacterium]|nr:aminotransferase class III-fold pyridoxal phosphate-dependent enzyme [Thermotogota bacterium]HPJ87890.1 aminotransferase class III-fold pyridoxal phosphate-dependent enzyme [Thermotogota bacterium]HPR94983.1 aminotransferase class III-fold pyridoxal phosphate-dependent enzyme [Thermotogota bacterium]
MYRMKMYDEYDFKVEKTEGIKIWDDRGRKYLDTFSGIGVLALGHSNPEVLEAQRLQMIKYEHISNFFFQDNAEDIARILVKNTGRTGQVFFTNSGTEAIEAALKAVKKKSGMTGKKIILTFENAFHGRTLGSLSLNGFEHLRTPFEPLFENIIRIPFNDQEAFEKTFGENVDEIIAVFVEPVLGSGGVVPIDRKLADSISTLTSKKDVLLVADEIQAGIGRTGKFYSYQHYGLSPDIITLGKAIGGGLPLGATIFLNGSEMIFQQGDHGSTFAPNPVSLAGGRIVVGKVENILNDIREKGIYFSKRLHKTQKIKEIRQIGLMIGIELMNEDKHLRDKAIEKGLLINMIKNRIIRILPAFSITYDEIDEMTDLLNDLIE